MPGGGCCSRCALPDCGGAPATVLVTLTVNASCRPRTGLATAGHGGLVSIPEALRIAAEADIYPVVVGDAGGVLGYGLTASRQYWAAAGAGRPRPGCRFPSCDRPPDWCESRHVTPWADSGATDVGNLILCAVFTTGNTTNAAGQCACATGCPEWIPPRWIDLTRTPAANTTHHVAIRFPPPAQPEWKGTTTGDPPRDLAPAYA